ncbi:oligosaccharide flippase family protein [Vibrio cholerae]
MIITRLYKNIFSLFFVQILSYLVPFIVLPYLTRILGAEGFGSVAIGLSISAFSMIVTDFGFNLSGTRWIALNSSKKHKTAKYLGAVFSIKLILLILSLSILLMVALFKKSSIFSLDAIIGLVLLFVSQAFQINWFFQGIEKMKYIACSVLFSRFLYVVIILNLVVDDQDWFLVFYAMAFSNLMLIMFSILFLYKENFYIALPRKLNIKFVFQDSLSFFISRLSVGLYTSISVFFVGSFSGVMQAAMYSCAEKIYQAGQAATSPISQALYPYIVKSKDINKLYKLTFLLLLPVSAFSICGFLFSEYILDILYGSEYRSADEILKVFSIILAVNFISVNFGYPAFAYIKKLNVVNYSVHAGSILHSLLLLCLFLIDGINALNVSLSILLIESLVMIIRVSAFVNYVRQK